MKGILSFYFLSIFSFQITGYGCQKCIQNEENNGLDSNIKQHVTEVNKTKTKLIFLLIIYFILE
jgi:hypothetical protein